MRHVFRVDLTKDELAAVTLAVAVAACIVEDRYIPDGYVETLGREYPTLHAVMTRIHTMVEAACADSGAGT